MEDLRESDVRDLLAGEGLRIREMAARIRKKEGVNCYVDSSVVRKVMLNNLMSEKVTYWPIIFTRSSLAQAILVVSSLLVHSLYCCYCVTEEIKRRRPKSIYQICRAQLERHALRVIEATKEAARTGKPVKLPEWTQEEWEKDFSFLDWSTMGSGASSQSANTQAGSIEELHGSETNISLMDLQSLHGSSIALMIISILFLGSLLVCN